MQILNLQVLQSSTHQRMEQHFLIFNHCDGYKWLSLCCFNCFAPLTARRLKAPSDARVYFSILASYHILIPFTLYHQDKWHPVNWVNAIDCDVTAKNIQHAWPHCRYSSDILIWCQVVCSLSCYYFLSATVGGWTIIVVNTDMDTANSILMAVPHWSFFFIGQLQIWNQGPAEKHGMKNREYK